MPGVPGIGVKTAAQLIGEYGDLETLLARASEIKQDKRRQTLIDNAELARISKKLVTLDENVKLDVPIDDLAVHEPDYRRLVAFLKAMEFNTLTRRVAEAAEIDVSQIEPDAMLEVGSAPGAPAPLLRGRCEREHVPQRPPPYATASTKPNDSPGGGATDAKNGGDTFALAAGDGAAEAPRRPPARPFALPDGARDHPPEGVGRRGGRGLARIAVDTETTTLDPMQAVMSDSPSPCPPTRRATCRSPTARRSGGNGDLFEGDLRPDQIPERDALDAIKPLLEDPGVLKIGQNLKYDRMVCAGGIRIAPFDDTMLLSYVLDAGRGGHGMDALSRNTARPQPHPFGEVAGTGKARSPSTACRSSAPPNMPPRTPT